MMGTAGVLLFLLAVAWTDAHRTRIPDELLLAGIPAVLLFVWTDHLSGIDLGQRLSGMAGVSSLLLCLTLFRPGAFGGGDVKLTALTGFLLGWRLSWYAFAVSVFSAGVYVLWKLLRKEVDRSSQIPFGPFLCLGTAGVLVFSYLYSIWNRVL